MVNGRPIKEGEVLNPKGRGAVEPDVRKARKLNKNEVAMRISQYLYEKPEVVTKIADYDPKQWKVKNDGPKPDSLDVIICNVIRKAGYGDVQALNLILERSVGKVPVREPRDYNNSPYKNYLSSVTESRQATKKQIDTMIKQRQIIQAEENKNE